MNETWNIYQAYEGGMSNQIAMTFMS